MFNIIKDRVVEVFGWNSYFNCMIIVKSYLECLFFYWNSMWLLIENLIEGILLYSRLVFGKVILFL